MNSFAGHEYSAEAFAVDDYFPAGSESGGTYPESFSAPWARTDTAADSRESDFLARPIVEEHRAAISPSWYSREAPAEDDPIHSGLSASWAQTSGTAIRDAWSFSVPVPEEPERPKEPQTDERWSGGSTGWTGEFNPADLDSLDESLEAWAADADDDTWFFGVPGAQTHPPREQHDEYFDEDSSWDGSYVEETSFHRPPVEQDYYSPRYEDPEANEWWFEEAANTPGGAGHGYYAEDEYELSGAPFGPNTEESTAGLGLFTADVDLDEPAQDELDVGEWSSSSEVEQTASKEPTVRQKFFARSQVLATLFSGDRRALMVAAVALILVATFVGKSFFSNASAVDGVNAASNTESCVKAKSSTEAKNLKSVMPAAPAGWAAISDARGDTGPIDHSKALRLEGDVSNALEVLDRTHFQAGYSRSYAGPDALQVTTTVYEFSTAACAQDYILEHMSTDVGKQSFATPDIQDVYTVAEPAGSGAVYRVRGAVGNRAFLLTSNETAASIAAIAAVGEFVKTQQSLLA